MHERGLQLPVNNGSSTGMQAEETLASHDPSYRNRSMFVEEVLKDQVQLMLPARGSPECCPYICSPGLDDQCVPTNENDRPAM